MDLREHRPLVAASSGREREAQRRTAGAPARSVEGLREFAFFLSHELRQPLASIRANLTLLDEELPDATRRAARARLERAAQQMEALIEAELQVAHLSRKEETWRPVPLRSVVGEALSVLEAELRDARACVAVGDLPLVDGHPLQLQQLFVNLLRNAVLYRRHEVPLRVDVHGERAGSPGRVRIRIADNGRGFRPDQAERIFELFERGGFAEGPGVGLGLAICRRIAVRHGGWVTAAGAEGTGAVFEVELPESPSARAAAAACEA